MLAGLCPKPYWRAYSAPPDPSCFQGGHYAAGGERRDGREGLGERQEKNGGKEGNGEGKGKGASWGSALVVGGIDAPGVACSHAAAIAIKVEVAAVYAMMLHREQVYQ